jgi:uncharacterized protein YecE (DUF72 family)
MVKWWIGCSGFHYKHWKEVFYPKGLAQKKWFEFYCQHFNTLELNVTFYRFPQLSFLESWHSRSPAAFKFAVKVPRAITHYKKFVDSEKLISDFYNTVREGLGKKLGCVLFQLPPRSVYTEERLEKIINSLDTSFKNVLEFRHESWWNQEVYSRLAKHKISFCGMSHPELPADRIENTKILYFRFHGVPELYKSRYDVNTLQRFADDVESAGKTRESYIYFNNDIGGSAIANAGELQAYCKTLKKGQP